MNSENFTSTANLLELAINIVAELQKRYPYKALSEATDISSDLFFGGSCLASAQESYLESLDPSSEFIWPKKIWVAKTGSDKYMCFRTPSPAKNGVACFTTQDALIAFCSLNHTLHLRRYRIGIQQAEAVAATRPTPVDGLLLLDNCDNPIFRPVARRK